MIYLYWGINMIDENLVKIISNRLTQLNISIATAESCTGGLLAHLLTNISGSSKYFERGVVTYSNKSKIELLGVNKDLIERYGAVSEETAKFMAQGIKNKSNVDIGISTTGIAGPTGGTKEKPVGLVFIGIATSKNIIVKRFILSKNRLKNKELTCNESLKFLLEIISKW